MWGAILRAAALAPIAVLFALLFEPMLAEIIGLMEMAPGGEESRITMWTMAIHDNWLFIALVSLLVLLIAAAVAERELGGGIR